MLPFWFIGLTYHPWSIEAFGALYLPIVVIGLLYAARGDPNEIRGNGWFGYTSFRSWKFLKTVLVVLAIPGFMIALIVIGLPLYALFGPRLFELALKAFALYFVSMLVIGVLWGFVGDMKWLKRWLKRWPKIR